MREFFALSDRYRDSEDGLNYRAALICSVMANLWGAKKYGKPYMPSDFMPRKTPVEQTPAQMFAMVKMLNAAFGGTVIEE